MKIGSMQGVVVPYSSMEGVIEQNKDSYYLALRRTQQTIRKEEQNWETWLVFFLKTMAKQKDNLAAKVKEEQALRSSLPALSRQILDLAKTRSEITVKEIEDTTGANRNTIKAICCRSGRDAAHVTPSNRRPDGYPRVLRIATLELFHCWRSRIKESVNDTLVAQLARYCATL